MIKKIVVLGPESTGKSTLCSQLANHFNTGWVKEYAREYLETNGAVYSYDMLLDIAKGQLALEEKSSRDFNDQDAKPEASSIIQTLPGMDMPELLFIDTNMYVLKVWCEFVYGQCHHWILNKIVECKYDLYLLCDIDLPWVKDGLREYPDMLSREKLYHHYKDILVNQEVPWVNISGNYEVRLQKAIEAVKTNLVF